MDDPADVLIANAGKPPSLFKSENYYVLEIQEIHIENESFIRKEDILAVEEHQVKCIHVQNSLVN